MARLWSSLSKATKARYRRQGVTAARYNAWQKKTPAQRKTLDRSSFMLAPARPTVAARAAKNLTTADRVTVATDAVQMLMTHPDVRFVNASKVLANALRASPARVQEMKTTPVDEWREKAASKVADNYFWYR